MYSTRGQLIFKLLISPRESYVLKHLDHFWKFRDMISTRGALPSDALCTKCVPKPESEAIIRIQDFFLQFVFFVPEENLTAKVGLSTF